MVDFRKLSKKAKAKKLTPKRRDNGNLPLGADHQQSLDSVIDGENVLITGPAGTGKSFLIDRIVRQLSKVGTNVVRTSSTGVSAVNIGGRTIHSFLGTAINGSIPQLQNAIENDRVYLSGKLTSRVRKMDALIIDEVSMLSGDYIDMVDYWLKELRESDAPFGGVQIIMTGDFFQLPPVQTEESHLLNHFAFQALCWSNLGIKVCYLNQCFRQDDPEFLTHLGNIRVGYIPQDTISFFTQCVGKTLDDPTQLVPTNRAAFDINERNLAKLPGELWENKAELAGDDRYFDKLTRSCIAEDNLRLRVGAKIIILVNDFNKGFVNGSRGEITGLDEFLVTVAFVNNSGDDDETQLPMATWPYLNGNGEEVAFLEQFPVKLAYAMTIHKSQGMTIELLQCDLAGCFECGQAYVALSRAKSVQGLSLKHPISPDFIKVSYEAVEFYNSLFR